MYTVYILFSKVKDRYYVGQTENLPKRLSVHNARKNQGTNDWPVGYTETFSSRSEAVKREKEIKSKKRRAYLEALINSSG